MIIVAKKRGTNGIFVPVSTVAWYAGNSAPIDGTDILCSIPAINRYLPILLTLTLMLSPSWLRICFELHSNILSLLTLLVVFSKSILKMLIEDHQMDHLERINNSRNLIFLITGNIVLFCMSFKVIKHRINLVNCVTLLETLTTLFATRVMVVAMFKQILIKTDSSEFKI